MLVDSSIEAEVKFLQDIALMFKKYDIRSSGAQFPYTGIFLHKSLYNCNLAQSRDLMLVDS